MYKKPIYQCYVWQGRSIKIILNRNEAIIKLKAKMTTKSDPGFASRFLDWTGFRSGCLVDRCQNAVDSFTFHFAECHENRAVTASEMLINLKSHILQWWGKWKSDPEYISGTGSPPKVYQFFWLVGPIITSSFCETADYFCSNPARIRNEWHNDRQMQCCDCIVTKWNLQRF